MNCPRQNERERFTIKSVHETLYRYRLLVENLNEGIAMQDENDVITFVNDRFLEMLGYYKG
jgi:PAS domain S-box-containing protein